MKHKRSQVSHRQPIQAAESECGSGGNREKVKGESRQRKALGGEKRETKRGEVLKYSPALLYTMLSIFICFRMLPQSCSPY